MFIYFYQTNLHLFVGGGAGKCLKQVFLKENTKEFNVVWRKIDSDRTEGDLHDIMSVGVGRTELLAACSCHDSLEITRDRKKKWH